MQFKTNFKWTLCLANWFKDYDSKTVVVKQNQFQGLSISDWKFSWLEMVDYAYHQHFEVYLGSHWMMRLNFLSSLYCSSMLKIWFFFYLQIKNHEFFLSYPQVNKCLETKQWDHLDECVLFHGFKFSCGFVNDTNEQRLEFFGCLQVIRSMTFIIWPSSPHARSRDKWFFRQNRDALLLILVKNWSFIAA